MHRTRIVGAWLAVDPRFSVIRMVRDPRDTIRVTWPPAAGLCYVHGSVRGALGIPAG